jgi:ABC-type phosphate/phosphonate transport system substrate-binding protein
MNISMQKTLITFLLVTLSTIAFAANESSPDRIIMGGSSLGIRDSSKQDTEITFNVALGELLKSHGANLSVRVFDSTEDLYDAFDNDKIQGLFGTPLEIIARESKLNPSIMAVHYKNVPIRQSLIALVRSSENVKNITDLRGKKLSIGKSQDMETLYLNTLLLENQQPEIGQFFSERLTPKNTNTGIMDVFFGRSDITIVRESEYKTAIELNPQIAKKLYVLAESAPYLVLVGAAKSTLSPASHKTALQSLYDISSTEKGQQLMRIIHAQSFETVWLSDLENVRELLRRYQSLKIKSGGSSTTLKTKKNNKPSN